MARMERISFREFSAESLWPCHAGWQNIWERGGAAPRKPRKLQGSANQPLEKLITFQIIIKRKNLTSL